MQSLAIATRDAGVEEPPRVGVGLAGRELHAGQQGGDGAAVGQRVDVGVVEVGAVVDRDQAELGGQPDAGAVAELVGVQPSAQAPGGARLGASARAWSASNAPRSQNTSTQRAYGAQASSIGPVTSATYSSGVAALGHHVRAEERGLVGELPGDRQAARLVADGQPVAALDLDRGRALPPHLVRPARATWPVELLVGRGPGGGDGRADAAGGVRRPGHPGGELRRAVAREDQVGVGVHEAGDDRAAAGVDVDVGGRGVGGGAGPGDPVALEDDGGVGDDAEEVVGLRVVGDQLADVGDEGAHGPRVCRSRRPGRGRCRARRPG